MNNPHEQPAVKPPSGRRQRRVALGIAALSAALVAAALAGALAPSPNPRTRVQLRAPAPPRLTSSTTTTPTLAPASLPARARRIVPAGTGVCRFAAAYVEYLARRLSPARLRDWTQSARDEAMAGRPIAHDHRDRTLRLSSCQQQGSTAHSTQALAVASDGAHRYPFTVDALRAPAGWRVTELIPPDVSVDQRPSTTRVAGVPARARAAAAAFALAYVDYDQGARHSPPAAAPIVINEIQAGADPLAGQPPTHLPATIVSIRCGPLEHDRFAASATVTDAGRRVTFTFLMHATPRGWQANGFL
jgi:hypothetical protein